MRHVWIILPLIAIATVGCKMDEEEVPRIHPVAIITVSGDNGAAPYTVVFDGGSSFTELGEITSYWWIFDDGSNAAGKVAVHEFASPGTYDVMLIVTSTIDLGGQAFRRITVTDPGANSPPVADISVDGPTSGDAPLVVNFDASGSSDPDGSATDYFWDFGDGSTATGPTVSHTYTTGGTYTVTLVVTDDDGSSSTTTITITVTGGTPNQNPLAEIDASPLGGTGPLEVSFSGAGSSDDDGYIVDYSWDFGDSAGDTGISVTHVYSPGSYTATLVVADNASATGLATVDIFVNARPTANINANPVEGNPPLTVSFSGSGSTDSDGFVDGYQWEFGDGGSAAGENVDYEYLLSGYYTATLTVTDDFGATALTTVEIHVNAAPIVVIDVNPTDPMSMTEVSFDGSGSYDTDGSILSYDWDFGDGSTATGALAARTYDESGIYTVELAVTDDLGGVGYATYELTVRNRPPTADIQADIYSGVRSLDVNFDGGGSTDDDGTVESWWWEFGDGGTSSSAAPSHTFGEGVHSVTLTVTDNLGDTGQAQTVIAVANWDEEVVRLTNIERWDYLSSHLPPLKKEAHLDAAALRMSNDMAFNMVTYIPADHSGTDGSTPGQRITQAGYNWFTYGENIAAGYATPADVVTGWMNSGGHRANIMEANFREIGTSYVYTSVGPYYRFWTQDFGARWEIFPVVIEREEFATSSSTVNLYIYGASWATQMMISNSSDFAGASWEAPAANRTWDLGSGVGVKTVYVRLTNGSMQTTYSDSIVVVEP